MELRSCEKQELEDLINRKNEEILRLQGLIASQKELHGNSALLEQHLEQSVVVRHLHGLLECNPDTPYNWVNETFSDIQYMVVYPN